MGKEQDWSRSPPFAGIKQSPGLELQCYVSISLQPFSAFVTLFHVKLLLLPCPETPQLSVPVLKMYLERKSTEALNYCLI